MPNWLPLFAGVNLAVALVVALPALARRACLVGRLLLAAVPALWALGIFAAYIYLQATMPPSPVKVGPDGSLIIRHGNLDWVTWSERLGMAHRVAFWVTLVTLVLLGVARAIGARGGRGRRVAA